MSGSLKSIICRGRFYIEHLEIRETAYEPLIAETIAGVTARQTVCVNAQAVWDDISPFTAGDREDAWVRAVHFKEIPRPRPPYPSMWLETNINGQRCGALVRTVIFDDVESLLVKVPEFAGDIADGLRRDQPKVLLKATLWHEFEGSAGFTAQVFWWLDAKSAFQSSFRFVIRPQAKTETELANDSQYQHLLAHVKMRQGWLLHSFARMNCANVELVPMDNPTGRHHHRRDRAPATVWHEIRVGAAPKIRSGSTAQDNGGSEVRLHWVRGHFADYTKGTGLFGNPKLRTVFWIPAHQAGDEKLGQVVPSYRIDQEKAG
jgi:hypothetical protein